MDHWLIQLPFQFPVRVFIFLLSGRFCCLGFSGVYLCAVWAGACLIFCCLGGGVGPAQTAKKTTRPRPNSKKINTPPTLPSVVFAVWAGGRIFKFCCLGGGACSFFCCLGRGREFTHLPVRLARS